MFRIGIKEWNKFEKIWLFSFLTIIIAATAFFSATGTDYSSTENILLNWAISPLSAATGIFCVVLAAKGKISSWTYGVVNSVLYGYLAYRSGYYGDAIINIFYFLPTQFIGMAFWKTRLKKESKTDVMMRKLTPKQLLLILLGGVAAAVVFGMLLHGVDSWFTGAMKRNESIYAYFETMFGGGAFLAGPILDSSTEVTQILAQIFMVLAFAEQWIFWIITNVITIAMWIIVIVADPASASWAVPTLIMWTAYLVNSVYGWVIWKRGASNE
jgi:nicotinamide mononucleotide transporter